MIPERKSLLRRGTLALLCAALALPFFAFAPKADAQVSFSVRSALRPFAPTATMSFRLTPAPLRTFMARVISITESFSESARGPIGAMPTAGDPIASSGPTEEVITTDTGFVVRTRGLTTAGTTAARMDTTATTIMGITTASVSTAIMIATLAAITSATTTVTATLTTTITATAMATTTATATATATVADPAGGSSLKLLPRGSDRSGK